MKLQGLPPSGHVLPRSNIWQDLLAILLEAFSNLEVASSIENDVKLGLAMEMDAVLSALAL